MRIDGRMVLVLLLACWGSIRTAHAQADIKALYPFIDTAYNKVENDTAMRNFYRKLDELKEGKRQQVVVVQVGDSHIQADFFSGYLRRSLQKKFGNAGRGLIFPDRVAGTNEPWSYHTSSLSKWDSKRNVMLANPLPIGVAGITLQTKNAFASINLKVFDEDSLNYGFNKITLFAGKGPDAYDYVLKDDNNQLLAYINSSDMKQDSFSSTICLNDPVHEINLNDVMTEKTQTNATLYGISLENSDTGLLYHTIGVNGADFRDYNLSQYFARQLKSLHPDLIIISLGTNDAFAADYTDYYFRGQVDQLVSRLQADNPGTDILLTSPPDGYRYNTWKNLFVPMAVNVMRSYSKEHRCAFWDFYDTMGGLGTIYTKWYFNHLAQGDLLHLTKTGYELQGKLLMDALLRSYQHWSLKP